MTASGIRKVMSWVTSSFHPAIGRRRYRYQSERVLYRAHWQHMCVWIEHLGELEGLEGLFTSNNFRMDILSHISILSRNSEPSERRNRQCL
jgi:hypothetical protein